jgi:transposase
MTGGGAIGIEQRDRLLGMEACLKSLQLARHLQAFGHQVCIIPARFVKLT